MPPLSWSTLASCEASQDGAKIVVGLSAERLDCSSSSDSGPSPSTIGVAFGAAFVVPFGAAFAATTLTVMVSVLLLGFGSGVPEAVKVAVFVRGPSSNGVTVGPPNENESPESKVCPPTPATFGHAAVPLKKNDPNGPHRISRRGPSEVSLIVMEPLFASRPFARLRTG